MSVIQWSTPERRAGDKILPFIPNEIYLIIFEHIAPTSTKLSPEQLLTFSKLSRICRFFCNVCLPRIFEDLEFSGSIFGGYTLSTNEAHMASRAWTLCQQIAAQQPLALYLAQCVKACHFTEWMDVSADSWAVQRFSELYISGVAHMKNICELYFLQSSVEDKHWDMITTLESLESLNFTNCDFVDGPAGVRPGTRLKVKVPCLRIFRSFGSRELTAVIDVRHLRTLTMDFAFVDNHVSWLSETALTELCICSDGASGEIKDILSEIPQSIQVLTLPVASRSDIELFGDPVWKNRPLLRSLTLQESVWPHRMASMTAVRMICEGVRLLRSLRSFTLQSQVYFRGEPLSPAEVRQTVQEQLSDLSGLNFVEIYGTAIRLVDGKWIDV
ncbi:hypothetical protein BDN67DRAFT_228582 [Paxillus ammoniavirescens]|nr:hypothetical protein BDN67DRAFT_228582 [Paxillus ammoniavirescens]